MQKMRTESELMLQGDNSSKNQQFQGCNYNISTTAQMITELGQDLSPQKYRD